MEQQMAILRLEKELEKARGQLSTMRKAEYQKNVNPEFNSGVAAISAQPTPAPVGRPLPSRPTPSGSNAPPPRPVRPDSGTVQWRQNSITDLQGLKKGKK
jgi:hypothetical protein